MDTLCKAKKLGAMSSYKAHFLHSLTIIAFTFSIVCLYSPIKQIFSFFLPNSFSSIFSPKCLFIVVNVIVVFLVRESKVVVSVEIYDEYVERSRSLRSVSTIQEIKAIESMSQENEDEEEIMEISKEEEDKDEEELEFQEVEQEAQEQIEEEAHDGFELESKENEEEDKKERDGEGEEENELPDEELNKKIEDFIARVNKQRWLEEARLLVCCSA